MRFVTAIVLFALSAVHAANPIRVKSTGVWTAKHRAAPSEQVTVGFVLKEKNLDAVEKLFWERTNPQHPDYAKWLSKEELAEMTHNVQGHQAVVDFLNIHNINIIQDNPHGEYVKATMSVAQAEQFFQTEFHTYASPHHAHTVVRTEEFTIPEDLEMHLFSVEHISWFQSSLTRPRFGRTEVRADAAAAGQYVTPSLISSTYGIPTGLTASSTSGATQSLFESLGQSFAPQDLTDFQKGFGLQVNPVVQIIGPNNPNLCYTDPDSCGEANLDVQYMMAVAPLAQTVYWYSPGQLEPFLDWIMAVAALSKPPLVHSISYGGYETDEPDTTKSSFSTQAMKLGLQGVTIVVSSGDDGAVNYNVRNSTAYCGYFTSFPSSCPYITSVGATQGPEVGKAEVACSSDTGGGITTGGGISKFFSTTPSYQATAVSNYLRTVSGKIYSGYPTTGRGSPDVSIMGHNYAIIIGGNYELVSGTSASAPVFGGMITLINDARLRSGKTALGFLNQALYQLDASTWNDITSGNSKCSAQQQTGINCCLQGFIATAGWDPLTGLGTPKFAKLKASLAAL